MRAIMTIAVAIAAAAAAPAFAKAQNCEAAPGKLRAMAASVDAETARKAERNIALGEALCDARNRSEAAKKFNLAAKAMGTDLASVMTPTASATVQ